MQYEDAWKDHPFPRPNFMLASFDQTTSNAHPLDLDDPLHESMIAWRDHGDETSARQIVEYLTPLLRGLAFRILPRSWMVEDAVQCALTKVFRSLDNFDPRVPLTAWATCIIKNVCSNMLRSWNRQNVFSSADLGLESLGQVEGQTHLHALDDIVMAREELLFVARCIANMEKRDRDLIHQTSWNESSAEELGRGFGLSAGAVRVRVCRIRSALKDALRRQNSQIKNHSPTLPMKWRRHLSTSRVSPSTRSQSHLQQSASCLHS
jgi:RNA polymerase sigma factor (sigma-70 family)